MKMYLISDNVDTLTGMRLAGVEGVVVHEKHELANALDFVIKSKDIGIVLLTEKFSKDYPELVNKFHVMSIPTLLVFKNGEVVNKSVGLISKDEVKALLG